MPANQFIVSSAFVYLWWTDGQAKSLVQVKVERVNTSVTVDGFSLFQWGGDGGVKLVICKHLLNFL